MCGSQQNQQGTGSAEYLMVHHMNETGDIYDSTSHGLDGLMLGLLLSQMVKQTVVAISTAQQIVITSVPQIH